MADDIPMAGEVDGSAVKLKWYILVGKEIQGPFSHSKIQKYHSQGRLKSGQMLSLDKEHWNSPEDCGFEPDR